jgi:GntR family transcriptional regulator
MQFNENKAIYIQIAERIADEIMLGVYKDDGRIPSVREYAARMEVNTNTALRSYAYLEQTGVIYQRRGLGYFTTPEARELIIKHYKEDFFGSFLPEMFSRMDILGIGIEEIEKLYNEHRKADIDTKQ